MDNDNKNFLEAGIAKTQIEAARRQLASGENLEKLQKERTKYLTETITGIVLVLFLYFLVDYIYFGANNLVVIGILMVTTSILIFLTGRSLYRKHRISSARKRHLNEFEK